MAISDGSWQEVVSCLWDWGSGESFWQRSRRVSGQGTAQNSPWRKCRNPRKRWILYWTALTSLLPLFPLINILIGFWGTAGGGAGASASPISEKIIVRFSILTSNTHTSCDSLRAVIAEFSLAQSPWLRDAQRKMGAHWRVLRSRGIGWKHGKPRRALRPGLSWDSTSRLLRLTLTLLSQLLLLIIDISIYMVKRIFWDCPPPSKSKTAFWRKSLKPKYYSACRHPLDDIAENCQWQLWTSQWQFE